MLPEVVTMLKTMENQYWLKEVNLTLIWLLMPNLKEPQKK